MVSGDEALLRSVMGKVTETLPENSLNSVMIRMHICRHSVTMGSRKSITPLLLKQYSLGLRLHIYQLA